MELSHRLVDHGFEVTFVCTELIHALLLDALRQNTDDGVDTLEGIHLVSIPDGMADGDDRRDLCKFGDGVFRRVPGYLEKLIKETEASGAASVKWLVADVNMWFCFPIAKNLGVRVAGIWPGAASGLGMSFRVTQMIEDGFIDDKAFELFPDIVPIGPLFADQELRKPVGQFWPADKGCLKWLDAQSDGSVVYVAFGSFTIFDPRQFRELAEGLELTGRPFLWVVRPDFTSGGLSKEWFDEFQSRVDGKGMIVSWCPQQQVLAHPALACFVSHCGWNSTTEGVRNGVPILCWPYFADQFANRSYICDIWMTGLAVTRGEDGVVTKEELISKLELVINDDGIAERVRMLRDAARRSLSKGGSSYENFLKFVSLLAE
ncbi:hypothetical protein QYE76_061764 [Lolium multiflorum]|uniref:Uncharacterized protein n=1 Tax=Lolium multiflorum TaxID=4521 RepID=A0AAD8S290_LOLMU|nr:hypothetical protein QYE76_061764 [Lolium multiflorum]